MGNFCGSSGTVEEECNVDSTLFIPCVILSLCLITLVLWRKFLKKAGGLPIQMWFWGHNMRWILTFAVIVTQVLAAAEGVIAELSQPGLQLHLYLPLSLSIIVSIVTLVAVTLCENRSIVIVLAFLAAYWVLLAINKCFKIAVLLGNGFSFEHSRCVLCFVEMLLATVLSLLEILPCFLRKCKRRLCDHTVLPELTNRHTYSHQYSNFLSQLGWNWLNDIMKKGFRSALQKEDLGSIPIGESATENHAVFQKIFLEEKVKSERKGKDPSLLRVYWRSFWPAMVVAGLCKVVAEQLVFVSPICAVGMVDYVVAMTSGESINNNTNNSTDSVARLTHTDFISNGYVLALLTLIATLVHASLWQNHFYLSVRQGIRCKAALQAMVYKKALHMSSWSMGKGGMSVGQVVNHCAVDPLNIFWFFYFGHFLWSLPIQVGVGMVLLYYQLGISGLIGAIFLVLTSPLQLYLAKLLADLQEGILGQSDLRLKKVNELLLSIKLLKLYAWEELFRRGVESVRNGELKYLAKVAVFRVISTVVVDGSPLIAILLTFTLYSSLETTPLSAGRVFAGLALFNLLSIPIAALPLIIGITAHAKVSTDRLVKFFMAPELTDYTEEMGSAGCTTKIPDIKIKNGVTHDSDIEDICLEDMSAPSDDHVLTSDVAVMIENGSYSWDMDSSQCTLNGINLSVAMGKLTMVVGGVGSGKSSLISALLGEMTQVTGKVMRQKGIDLAYGGQKVWLMNATLRDNILFGEELDVTRYNRVLDACALRPDLQILTAGDMTEIGEKGINLSGGQKQRVSIARTLYSTAQLVILDDPLSALDVHVGGHILEEGILKFLITDEKRTVLLVTHQIQYLNKAHWVVAMKNGCIEAQGSPQQIEEKHSELYKEWEDVLGKKKDDDENDSDDKCEETYASEDPANKSDANVAENEQATKAQSTKPDKEDGVDEEDIRGRLIEEEDREEGAVKTKVYVEYVRNATFITTAITLLAYVVRQALRMGTDFWLASWSEAAQAAVGISVVTDNSSSVAYSINANTSFQQAERYDESHFRLWFAVLCSLAVLGGCVATSMIEYSCLTAARHLHANMLNAVVLAPVRFFDITPVGRILNRFSGDTSVIDQKLPVVLDSMIFCILHVFGGLIVNAVSTPVFLVPVIPMIIMYIAIQRFYISSSRELQRLDNITKSPILAHLSETLGGLSTIRAYRKAESFERVNEKHVDSNSIAFLFLHTANVWMGIRLDLLGAFIVFTAAVCSISSGLYGFASPGIVGLSIAYAIMISGLLNWMMRYISEAEMYFNSVERVSHFSELPSEAYHKIDEKQPSSDWPCKGNITLENVSLRYDTSLDPVIKDLSLVIKGGEKVGICGRTGSGKSSLTLGLFHIIDVCGGRITIDDLDISQIPLRKLRTKLSIIPQDPVLFEGSVRLNLDPDAEKKDEELWDALEIVCLKDAIRDLQGELDGEVTAGGDNFSVGQRQLFCIARALLRNSQILVMDEATASIDMATDAVIQQVIQNAFKHCTVLTIAHRVSTILTCDKIIVLKDGVIAEEGSPEFLLQQPGSIFSSMVNDNK